MSTRKIEGGAGTVYKSDFNNHTTGVNTRHKADQIDLASAFSLGGTTVQAALNQLANAMGSGSGGSGGGFVSIGNAAGSAVGSYNINTASYTDLKAAFNAAVADPRLVGGGVILLMAGTYTVTSTITVPAGITVMGEVGGTLIVGETSGNTPIFLIKRTLQTLNIAGNSGAGTIGLDTGSNVDAVKFYNLMLADNLYGNANSSAPTMNTCGMINVENSANFVCERVSFIGRLGNGVVTNRAKTLCAIKTVIGGPSGTNVKILECFIDGVKIGIDFRPGLGSVDFLTVENTKARIYGSESTDVVANNCFILSSLCNAKISNNFAFMAGSVANYFLNFTSAASTTDIFVTLIGNSGKPANDISSTSATKNEFITNTSGATFRCTNYGNNWGHAIGNSWSIVVGGSDTNSAIGDIFGPDAIDVVLQMASNNYDAITCIVNPGTYVVNGVGPGSQNSCNVNFIGNKRGNDYPQFNLNINTSTDLDVLEQRFLKLGSRLESIIFSTPTAATTTIITNFGLDINKFESTEYRIDVIDCMFLNTTLSSPNVSINETFYNDINIEHCLFYQDGSKSTTLSCLIYFPKNLNIRHCNFKGAGYALFAGKQFQASNIVSQVNIENCIFDHTGFTNLRKLPTATNSAGIANSFINISRGDAKVTLKNCQIFANSNLRGVETYNTSDLSETSATQWCNILARSVTIDNCIINGPEQLFYSDVNGIRYALPSLKIIPTASCYISKSKFVGGTLPLQIYQNGISTTDAALEYATRLTGDAFITIQDCEFRNHSSSNGSPFADSSLGNTVKGKGFTLLDIDLSVASSSSYSDYKAVPKINITNNIFSCLTDNEIINSGTADDGYQVFHTDNTDVDFHVIAAVQIYARQCHVDFNQNVVQVNKIKPLFLNTAGYHHYAAVGINTAFNDGYATTATNINCIGNTVNCRNGYVVSTISVVDEAYSASAMYLEGPTIKVIGNTLALENTVTPVGSSPHFIGSLFIYPTGTAVGEGTGIVQGNYFSKRNNLGWFSAGHKTNSKGFVYIQNGSEHGICVDNVFSDNTLDFDGIFPGTNTSTVFDFNGFWIVNQNKNQTDTVFAYGDLGNFEHSTDGSTANDVAIGAFPTGITTRLSDGYDSTTTVQCVYDGVVTSGAQRQLKWHIPIVSIVPSGAYITKISAKVSANDKFSGNSSLFITTKSSTAGVTTGNTALLSGTYVAGTQVTSTINFSSNTFYAKPTEQPRLSVILTMSDTVAPAITTTILPIEITYRW